MQGGSEIKRFAINASIVVILGLGIALVLSWAWGGGSAPAVAAPRAEGHIEAPSAPAAEGSTELAEVLHVCPSGCTYSSIQDAVDAANNGDVIKVASGVYADVHVRPHNDITTTGFVTQVVYISKTITIRGGCATDSWTTTSRIIPRSTTLIPISGSTTGRRHLVSLAEPTLFLQSVSL